MWILFYSYPDVMMPAYIRSRWSVIYFAVYIAVVLYFLMGLVRFQHTTMYKLWHRSAPHYCQLILIYFHRSLPIWQVTWLWWCLVRFQHTTMYKLWHRSAPHYCQLILIYFHRSLPIWQVTWLWWWLLLRLLNVSHYNQQHSESS